MGTETTIDGPSDEALSVAASSESSADAVLSDTVLWTRSLGGDSQAFAALFDRHRVRVLRYAYRVLDDGPNADDVMAMAFLELWNLRHKVRLVQSSVLPWLLVTTGNIAKNSNRARRRYTNFPAQLPAAGDEPDFSDDLGASLDRRTEAHDLATALQTLSRTDQNLINLVVCEEVSLREAGTALGLSYEAAKSRLQRAKRKLGVALADRYSPKHPSAVTSAVTSAAPAPTATSPSGTTASAVRFTEGSAS